MDDDRHFTVTRIEGGAVFAINRPDKLNTLTNLVLDGLEACIDALEGLCGQVLIVRGKGERAFCAGTDLAELQAMPLDAQVAKCARARDLMVRLSRSPILSVAAIDGFAFGAGMELAMSCTLRIAEPSAVFSLPEIKLGLLPAYAGTQMLPALVGRARAEEIMLTGRRISSEEAERIGLVHRIARNGPTTDQAIEFVREISGYSPQAIRAIRACVAAYDPSDLATGLRAEHHAVQEVFGTDNARSGIVNFLGKRAKH